MQYTFFLDYFIFFALLGDVKATTSKLIKEEDWINYPCVGQINISQQYSTHTEGNFQLTAFDEDGIIIHQLQDGYFEIAN